ncbi:universal stress protein [Pseudarthrobacter sp. P1]|uniref:universal stress protein n=1 Tax=Pseudarthrobacter sp. P1 TaxID=3418418 RepID=UPI003CF8203C
MAVIVVGSRGHGGFPGLRRDSVSTQIIHHARSPVLVVRSETAWGVAHRGPAAELGNHRSD